MVFDGKLKEKEMLARKQNSVYYWDKKGMEAVVGKEADKVKETILGSKELGQIDDFRGLTASVGKAIGRVKILKSVTEISKVEQGDILVAVMTRPDSIPAMKKASAIVTDEGGITCHAAIVSRELKIPCIIGTKIATKVLKDGQLVEVNANHGWVKIIKTK
jgi:pyruvate,water dikinase